MPIHRFLPAILLLALPALCRAEDSVAMDGLVYKGTVNGLKDGRLSITLQAGDKLYDLDKVQVITLSANQKFTDAEIARPSDAKKATALYRDAVRTLNNPALKQLAELRAIEPTDADGKWTDAVAYFLDVYAAHPTDAVWKLRPTHMPGPPSAMLKESADRIAAAVRNVKSDEVKKNLKTFQLDILTKAGDTDAAQRLAKEIATGVVEEPVKPRDLDPAAQASAALAEVDAAIKAKNVPAALKRIDVLLDAADTATAVQLFQLQSRAYQEQNQPALAVGALLRIPAHYPATNAAPAALFEAATLERAANPDAAKALLQDILDRYPDSPEAAKAKFQ